VDKFGGLTFFGLFTLFRSNIPSLLYALDLRRVVPPCDSFLVGAASNTVVVLLTRTEQN